MKVLWILLLPMAFWIEKAALIVPPFPCDKLDLTMVLDRTESIGPSLFNKMKILAADLTDRFYVSPTQTRLLVIPFGQDATVLRNDDKASFRRWTLGNGYATKKEIEAMTELHNITNLHIALDLAFQAYTTEGKQDRQGVPNIVILITDGKTHDETALDAVLQSKLLNTYVIAVALGKEANAHRGVLDRTADEVIDWTLPKGERSSNDVLNDIMNRFDFERCDGSQPGFLTIEKFGCFSTEYTDSRKNRQPAMESIENSNCWLLSNTSLQRREAFERCAWCCWKLGHKYFALDGDNGCSAASVAWKIYQGGHPDSNDYCTEKRGGSNSNVVYYLKDCQAFGLENKAIADGKMSASSERNAHHSAKHGRLFSQRAWSAGIKDAEQWLEVDLSIMGNIVNRVGTQGSSDAEEWVTVYKLLYSYRNSPVRFKFAQRLDGNSDSNTVVYHKLKRRFLARYVRFQPLSWNVWPSMRVELYFCKPGNFEPKVAFGAIGCLKPKAPPLMGIPNEVVNRMPGDTFENKCAWAARTELKSLSAVNKGICAVSDADITDHIAIGSTRCQGNAEVFAVGAYAPCLAGKKRKGDISIVADIKQVDVHYLVTLVDTLQVSEGGNKAGIVSINTANAIQVDFNQVASTDETKLLTRIRNNVGKPEGFVSQQNDYVNALTRVEELYTRDRRDFRDVLLFVTDATSGIAINPSAFDRLKNDGVLVVVVGMKAGVDSSTQSVFENIATTSDDVVLMTGNMPKYYYKYGMNQILRKLCPSPGEENE